MVSPEWVKDTRLEIDISVTPTGFLSVGVLLIYKHIALRG